MAVDADQGGEVTLAFSVGAIERLAEPAAAFEDARGWSRHVGVIDNEREPIEETLERYDLDQDFDQEDEDKWLALERIRETTMTPRHVYLGVNEEDRRVATSLGWEFIHVTDAAAKAGWTLREERSDSGLIARVRSALPF